MSVNKLLFLPLFICLFVIGVDGLAQQKSRKEYEKERKALQQKIALGKKVLDEIEGEKANSLGELRALKEQVATQRSLINTLQQEVNLVGQELAELTDIITAMENDVKTLKDEYAQMIYEASKVNNNYNHISYLFSAKTLSEMSMRLEYLNQFNHARKVQVTKINQVMQSLLDQKEKRNKEKVEKDKLLNKLKKERADLSALRTKQDRVIEKLNERQDEHRKEINKWKKRQEELDGIIKKLIASEIKKQNNTKVTTLKERRGLELLSKNFEANKGRLPWPLERCSITRKFGQHKDPLLGIMENNLGIGLMGSKGATVKAVFEGKVSIVTTIRGQNQMIMVKHGTYFTVYINLTSVSVKPGDVLTTGQSIGTVHTNDQGLTELEFHVWKGAGASSQKLNPEYWLHK